MPKSPALRSSLWGLNRARLLTAAIVLAVGALLRFTEAFPYAFGTFAMTVLGGAAACLALPLAERRGVSLERIAWLQFGLDAVLITGIVTASGGPRSVFIPLYVLLVVASCFVLSGRGGLVIAGICSLLYVLPVLGRTIVPMLKVGAPSENTALEILTVFMNAGVLLAVAVVTGALAERYHELQQHMEDQRKHLSDLQAFRDLIFESVGSGLVGVDPNGRVTAFNRAAESITGVSTVDALDQPWEAIFGSGVDLAEATRAVAEGSEPAPRYEFRLRRRDGQEVPVGISFWSLRSGAGDVAGLIGVCQDLSSIKQMEQRMRQADRLAAVGRLSANMAHEIRNPLASISGAVEALARDLPPDHTRGQLVEIVLRESARLNQIVGDFLEYARPAPMAPIEINMAEILDEVLLLIEHRALPANLKVSREYGETLPVRADPQRLRQAVWNLCLNAVQAMPDGGELRVGAHSLRERGGHLQISITDTGQGIAETDLPHIFEPFFSTKPEGSGIGLALVYRVVEEHGGSIEVRSRVGEGTTFFLALPSPAGVSRG
ncbi:MAG TPA: ATP-binding protein [Candidatus Deferrimicrobiaceae bacterium]|nr:ATP-binding protein [Candidatus Deferrimicrobiaceae bacterium]